MDLASTRADVGSSLTHHARQSSQELPAASSTADGGFLELQMAKLLARKGIDEMDAAVKGDSSGGIKPIYFIETRYFLILKIFFVLFFQYTLR